MTINTNPEIITYAVRKNRYFPNSTLPVLIYKAVCKPGKQKRKAAKALQTIFYKNNWKNAWSNGIYSFHHYHSNTHECMAVASGKASVIIGGPGGRRFLLQSGDVIIIPAGVAHRCTKASEDFLCVGAYPSGKEYDTNTGTKEEYAAAVPMIKKLATPAKDPVLGKEGFLKTFWLTGR